MLWTPKRLPGKNLECIIACMPGSAHATIAMGAGRSIAVREHYTATSAADGCEDLTVDPHGCPDELPPHWLRMRQGPKSGLSDDTGALAGRHVLHQAINLAVHLGFSRIYLMVPEPDPRLRRALDSIVRPLRHKRVLVTGCAPFPEE